MSLTKYAVAGTNNIHVMGGMQVKNASTGAAADYLAQESWTAAALPLAVGANTFVVTGSNQLNLVSSDTVIVTRGRVGTAQPYVDATSTSTRVTYSVSHYVIFGTNNVHVQGGMLASNSANGAAAAFPATPDWSTPALLLAVGSNTIYVIGTNLLGVVASDSVVIERGDIGTGEPFLDITSSTAFVTYDTVTYAVAGTNNSHVMGRMAVSNVLNGATADFAADASWTTPLLPLAVGDNTFIVTGTNYHGVAVSDSVVIERGGIGTGQGFLDVTNDATWVTHDVMTYAVAGTNNIHVMGGMLVSNALNGATADFPAGDSWTTPVLPLDVGLNTFIVSGTNHLDVMVSDSVVIERGGEGTGLPFVDITNEPPAQLNYHIDSFVIGGTNNMHVEGDMWWSNGNATAVGVVTRTNDDWMAEVSSLIEGTNTIYVFGSNLLDIIAFDTISICRGFERDLPLIDPIGGRSVREHQVLLERVTGRANIRELSCDDSMVKGACYLDTNTWLFSLVPDFSTAGKQWQIPFIAANEYGVETQSLTVTVQAPAKGIDAKRPYRFEDTDGDTIDIKYNGTKKAGSKVVFDGQNVTISNGYPNGKLVLKVKPNRNAGDGTAELRSISVDSDSKSLVIGADVGALDTGRYAVKALKFNGKGPVVSNITVGSAGVIAMPKGTVIGTASVSNGFDKLIMFEIDGGRILAGVPVHANLTNTPARAGFLLIKADTIRDAVIAGKDVQKGKKMVEPKIEAKTAVNSTMYHTKSSGSVSVEPVSGK